MSFNSACVFNFVSFCVVTCLKLKLPHLPLIASDHSDVRWRSLVLFAMRTTSHGRVSCQVALETKHTPTKPEYSVTRNVTQGLRFCSSSAYLQIWRRHVTWLPEIEARGCMRGGNATVKCWETHRLHTTTLETRVSCEDS